MNQGTPDGYVVLVFLVMIAAGLLLLVLSTAKKREALRRVAELLPDAVPLSADMLEVIRDGVRVRLRFSSEARLSGKGLQQIPGFAASVIFDPPRAGRFELHLVNPSERRRASRLVGADQLDDEELDARLVSLRMDEELKSKVKSEPLRSALISTLDTWRAVELTRRQLTLWSSNADSGEIIEKQLNALIKLDEALAKVWPLSIEPQTEPKTSSVEATQPRA